MEPIVKVGLAGDEQKDTLHTRQTTRPNVVFPVNVECCLCCSCHLEHLHGAIVAGGTCQEEVQRKAEPENHWV